MTFTEAAAEILRLTGKPLHYREITELAIEKNLLSHVGKNPEVTMGSRLVALTKKDDEAIPIVRVRPGVFALREWEDGKPRTKAAVEDAAGDEDAPDINALEVGDLDAPRKNGEEPTSSEEPGDDDDDELVSQSPEDALRADLAASAADLFDDEDDDDQPILAPSTNDVAGEAGGDVAGQAGGAPGEGGGRRRRRRRRRRGGGGDRPSDGGPQQQGGGGGFTAAPVDGDAQAEGRDRDRDRDPLAPAPRPMIRDRQQIMSNPNLERGPVGDVQLSDGEELAGRDLADAALVVLGAFDRNGGPVGLRTVVDALAKRGRLSGDPAAGATQLAASLRADNMRRTSQGMRPRFRFSNGRCAPTEWLLGPDLVRMEQEAQLAVDRYRDTARRTLLRRIQELPGHAFVELALIALERCGMSNIRLVKRAGSPGGEAHFAAVHKTGSDEIRTAIVIRKDGREIGRERVADLRGALHHYTTVERDVGGKGPAVVGWLVTTGQVLSGAREEAAAGTAPPVALYDGLSFCKLLEDHEVGVVRTRMTIALPDLELLETLRG